MALDFSTDFGKRAQERLEREQIGWLVTTGRDGTPQPSPVWFLWDGATFLIYSEPATPKVRNLQRQPQVAFHLNSDEHGNDIVILTGEASVEPGAALADVPTAYLEKYRQGIASINLTPESMIATYSTAIHIRPMALRGH